MLKWNVGPITDPLVGKSTKHDLKARTINDTFSHSNLFVEHSGGIISMTTPRNISNRIASQSYINFMPPQRVKAERL